MDANLGRCLGGRYELLDVVGVGGMAVVYRARDTVLNRFVAVKVLKKEFVQDADIRKRFSIESQAVAKLSQSNIVAVYDVGSEDDTDYIVMELIEGITLKDYLGQKGRLSCRETIFFAEQICRALEHAHSRGIIHQDIKPQNVIILRDGTAKLTDFGIASFAAQQETRVVQEAIGSVHYISPEQAKGVKIDYRTDLYSLGVVMYEMLTGSLPFDGDTALQVVMQHINEVPPAPQDLVPDLPQGISEVVMHAMCANLDRRYPSAKALLQDLERLSKNEQSEVHFAAAPQPTAPPPAPPVRPTRQAKEGIFERLGEHPGLAAAISVGIISIILFILIFFLMSGNGGKTDKITVPTLIGKDIEQVLADTTLAEQFALRELSPRVQSDAPVGEILDQSVLPGQQVALHTIIELTVSAGGGPSEQGYEVPNFVGKKIDYVTTVLDEKNISYQIEKEYSETVAADEVIKTSPEAGSTLKSGRRIVITVSRGKEGEDKTKVPLLFGLSEQRARALLQEKELTVGSVQTVDNTAAQGTVVYQSIAKDTEVAKNTAVDLHISSGKKPEEKPEEPDTPPADPEQPTTEPDTPPADPEQPPAPVGQGKAAVQVALPPSTDLAHVVITVDGVVKHDQTYPTAQGVVTVTLEATAGQHAVTVSIDGNSNTATYNFQ